MTKNGERREIPINATLRATLEELFKGTAKRPRRIDVPYVFYRVVYDDPTEKTKINRESLCECSTVFCVSLQTGKDQGFPFP